MIKSEPKKATKNYAVKVKITKENKLRRLKKQLKTAGGQALKSLNDRIQYWVSR